MPRFLLTALALTLCACSPPAAKEGAPVSETPAPAAPSIAAPAAPDLSGPLAQGAWIFEEGNIASSTGFGLPESESQFFVQCERGPKIVSLGLEHELAPDQDTTMTIRTSAGSFDVPARSFNEGAPMVTANLPAPNPAFSALAAAQERFTVSVGAQTLILPADESIARVLALCGVK